MKLNKSTAYVLVALMNGCTTSAEIANYLRSVELRTTQRALKRLQELSVITQIGPDNDPTYHVDYSKLTTLALPEKLLIDEKRPESSFNYTLLDWLEAQPSKKLAELFDAVALAPADTLSPRDLEHLTIELSWKSSALEGNTYSLLDTQLLLTEGMKPANRTEFETQMIMNHKDTIVFIMENRTLFAKTISFATVEELHRIVGRNLGIASGVRKKRVHISASNYTPPQTPAKIRESADRILSLISKQQSPYIKALLAFSLVPYLQIFEDGNKRTGRMLANAILISSVNRGFSLRRIDARDLALAYLAFYEFNSMHALAKILRRELS